MRADDGVDRSLFKPIKDALPFRGCSEAVQQSHLDRIWSEAFRQRSPVLLGKHRCWGQHRHLFACGDGLEDGANRNLGLAETNITADKPVHRLLPFHVTFDVRRGFELVRSRFIGE